MVRETAKTHNLNGLGWSIAAERPVVQPRACLFACCMNFLMSCCLQWCWSKSESEGEKRERVGDLRPGHSPDEAHLWCLMLPFNPIEPLWLWAQRLHITQTHVHTHKLTMLMSRCPSLNYHLPCVWALRCESRVFISAGPGDYIV